ncbi:MAG: response regulator [Myxococcales bacterium]|nr:response regulator [Myxococcales bacterium]MDD9966430.1 response regulator [Myxococcales bacterium]
MEASLRALVVDDSEFSRVLVRRCLEGLGIEVVVAENGMKGIEVASVSTFHVILADVNMPFVDGIEMLKTMRSLPGYESVPFVVITAETSSEAVAGANELGIKAWMAKPIQPRMLAKAVERLLAERLLD